MTFAFVKQKLTLDAEFQQLFVRGLRFGRWTARVVLAADELHRGADFIEKKERRALVPYAMVFDRVAHVLDVPVLQVFARVLVAREPIQKWDHRRADRKQFRVVRQAGHR